MTEASHNFILLNKQNFIQIILLVYNNKDIKNFTLQQYFYCVLPLRHEASVHLSSLSQN